MAIKIEDVMQVLSEQKIEQTIINKVVNQLEAVEEDNKSEKATGPKQKRQFVIVVKGNEETKALNLAGWVVQIPADDDVNDVLPRLRAAASDTVAAQKRKRRAIETVSDAFRHSKAKILKEKKLLVKTKEIVTVIVAPETVKEIV